MEAMVWQAREAHRKAIEQDGFAVRFRRERNTLIQRLYASGDYSYSQLAKLIGCSPELVAKAAQGQAS